MVRTSAFIGVAAAALVLLANGRGECQPLNAQVLGAEVENIFPLAPRELRQRLSRAQAAVAEERFSDAVQEIGEILNATGSDDYFLGVPGSTDAQPSLKTEALALLGSMPAKGRRMYELQYGSDAKVALEAALDAGDVLKLTEVSRRYFQTKAGYEATLLLGRLQLDQGRPLAAALTLKRVADVPTALAQYDPELSVLLATCWIHANQSTKAEETLVALKQRVPQARVRLVDREVSLFTRDNQALEWLRSIVGGARSTLYSAQDQWAVHRGDERRNAQSRGGVPLLNFNWRVSTVNHPKDEALVAQQLRVLRDRDEPLIPALQPLVVHNYAIVREPEGSKLIGINLKTTKRDWIYPPFEDNKEKQAESEAMQANRGPVAGSREEQLRQRIWQDHIFGQVSSDGRQVYLIDELSMAPNSGVNVPPNVIVRGGRAFPNPSATKPYNMLVALDLDKQGYLVWQVGGTTGDQPALAGAFFLGPPLPVGDQLYALAEFSGEIRLVCLDSRTGALDWKQQLAVLEGNPIMNDRPRRIAGASPSLADGILVCPTSAGAVVAIDLTTRTLRWGYQYRRNDVQYPGGRLRGAMMGMATTSGPSWLDATATIADGCVILTPPESQQLHCLDLLTGKARWSPIPREDMLLVACIHDGKIILVGKNRVKAINLADGRPAWENEIKLDGEVVVGRGYYSAPHYYLPVTGQKLCKIDLKTGAIAARAQTEIELGNLVCYKDQLISLSPQAVASFVLFNEDLARDLEARLAANSQDVDALALKAQVLLQESKADESLELLRRAGKLAPERTTLQGLLVKVMLALVRQDLANNLPLTDELIQLVTDPAQRREVLRYRVQGLVQSERTADALAAILELADQELTASLAGNSPMPLQSIDRERSIRTDRWLQGQLVTLLNKADSELRERIEAEAKQRLDRLSRTNNVNQLRAFLGLFGFSAAADEARLTLIYKLLPAEAVLEAELLAGELLAKTDRPLSGASVRALASVYEKAKRPELAAQMQERLAGEYAGVTLPGLPPGAERPRSRPGKAQLASAWPIGRIDVKEDTVSTGGWMQRSLMPLELTSLTGAAPRGLQANYDPQRNEITVRSDLGGSLGTASLRTNDPNRRAFNNHFGNNTLTGKANGHLLVFHLGLEIVAVDALKVDRATDTLLWRLDAADDPNQLANQRLYTSGNRNPLLGSRNNGYDVTLRPAVATGPVGSVGVAFARGRQIVCVHPLNGEPLWERNNSPQADIPQQAALFGDEQLIFVADGRMDSRSAEAIVLSPIDGSLLGRRTIGAAARRWTTCGRNVLTWEEKGSLVALRLVDAWSGQELWSRQVAKGARGDVVDGEELAVLEPGGQFTLISLATGKVQFSVPLEPESALGWIQLLRSHSQYLLLASQEVAPGVSNRMGLQGVAGNSERGMHGRIYSFSRATGKLQWPLPAYIADHWLPADQPSESPLLCFVSMRQANNRASTQVLAIDRRTGETVYEKELNTTTSAAEVVADPAKKTVVLSLTGQNQQNITFQFTDQPRPPQPPAQTGEMASNSVKKQPGIVDQGLNAAIELLRRGINPGEIPLPGILPQR